MNRLHAASSPYLRQHRDNPVDWWEWSPEAFDEARRSGRPVLLSVGYSACHWCHVMAHESFEDQAVAGVMNELFVCIKVDREERPDVDSVYMDAVQAMTGRGGWPMTVFLTPDAEPFWGGTYYPAGAFVDLMRAVDDAWRNRRGELQANVDALVEVVGRTAHVSPADTYDWPTTRTALVSELRQRFDPDWGGFGGAPKFPSTFAVDTVVREFLATGDESLLPMATLSLDSMACGGMYDHIGGGFARYSTDEKWLVPHFEKMLYDQALLARCYVHAWRGLGRARYHQVASETIDYVLSTLRHPLGGFYSAEDADSLNADGHHEEGAFYTWSPGEIEEALGEWAPAAAAHWGITHDGNFEGRSIPNRIHARPDIGRPDIIERCRRTLNAVRNERPRPGLDDKVLTEWNAMFLSTLAEAALLVGNDRWTAAAVANGVFLWENLRQDDGTWRRSWQEDASPRARHDALAQDLAHVVEAFVRLYELTGNETWLDRASATAAHLVENHWDDTNGGFFTTSHTAESLVARQKDLMDNATPSANSVAAVAFLRLAALTGDMRWHAHARRTLDLLASVVPQAPTAFCNAAAAFDLETGGVTEVVIPGSVREFMTEYRNAWRPHAVLAHGRPVPGYLWEGREEGRAYVCRGAVCDLPAGTAAELSQRLDANRPTR